MVSKTDFRGRLYFPLSLRTLKLANLNKYCAGGKEP